MNNENKLLDVYDLLNIYKCPPKEINKNKYLPINTNNKICEEYAYLIGKIIGDGNLDHKYTLRFIGNYEELNLLKKMLIEEFKINIDCMKITKRINKGISYLLQVNFSLFGRILSLLGAPIGNKTKIKFLVPDWIIKRKTFTKRFLQALLEDELTTIKIERCNYSVNPRLKMAKRKENIDNLRDFLTQIKGMIESFDIKCSHLSKNIKTNNELTYEIYFHINRNKTNIMKFKENLGFRFNKYKQDNLNQCYEIIKNSII